MEQLKQKKDWSTVAWLILFFPVGLYKMWRSNQFPLVAKMAITSLFALIPYVSHNQNTQVTATVVPELGFTARKIASISPDELDQQKSILEKMLNKNINKRNAELSLRIVRWKEFYFIGCTLGRDTDCGVYEVAKDQNKIQLYWVNGNAGSHVDNTIQRSPNAGSKYSTASAFNIVTGKK